MYETVRHIYDALAPSRGAWSGEKGYVAQHLLPRLYGFELMMAPYAVAHLKLGLLLDDTGYNFPHNERLRVYLTNTLEEAEVVSGPLLALASQIAREANAASKVKTECPIMVIMGNPPYSGHSENKGDWIESLIEDYKKIHGKRIRLGQAKWLHNDYVKFIRFAQHRIEATGYGIIAMITDHSYIDSGTFVAMRANLQDAFDEIYVLDLQGNAKRNRNRPDTDENVFDITQGTAILIAVKKGDKRGPGQVFSAEIRGLRRDKYRFLEGESLHTTVWEPASCEPPYYLFTSASSAHLDEYSTSTTIREIFPGSYRSEQAKRIGTGFVSTHDSFAIAFTSHEVGEKIERFLRATSESEARDMFRLCSQSQWSYEKARKRLLEVDWRKRVRSVLYRPFDARYTVWDPSVCVHRRLEVHNHVRPNSRILCVGQAGNVVGSDEWGLVFVSTMPVDFNCFYRGGCATLPLYLYPDERNMLDASPWPEGKEGRRPNLSPGYVEAFAAKVGLTFISDGAGDLKKTFGPEDIFHYCYAVFHSPTYRSRYAEFLKIDFPRLPLTSDGKLFARLCELGAELVGLHLLERVPTPRVTYPRPGGNVVERTGKKAYKPPTSQAPGRVYINDAQYFESVPPEVWDFHVGGYQVCEKWLKDRKGRTLSYDDIETYRRITEAVRQTIRLMAEIDAAIPSWPLP